MKRLKPAIIIIGIVIIVGILLWLNNRSTTSTPIATEDSGEVPRAPVANFSVQTMDELRTYTQAKAIPPTETSRFVRAASPDEHIRGNAEAPFSIIEFANIQNAYTVMMQPIIRSVVQGSSGDVNWVFRQYPIAENPLDYLAAQATECVAAERGNVVFWQYLDSILAEARLTEELIYSAAESFGVENIRECISSERTRGHVVTDKQDGQLDGDVFVTPSFFIRNNATGEVRYVEGANPPEYFEKILTAME